MRTIAVLVMSLALVSSFADKPKESCCKKQEVAACKPLPDTCRACRNCSSCTYCSTHKKGCSVCAHQRVFTVE